MLEFVVKVPARLGFMAKSVTINAIARTTHLVILHQANASVNEVGWEKLVIKSVPTATTVKTAKANVLIICHLRRLVIMLLETSNVDRDMLGSHVNIHVKKERTVLTVVRNVNAYMAANVLISMEFVTVCQDGVESFARIHVPITLGVTTVRTHANVPIMQNAGSLMGFASASLDLWVKNARKFVLRDSTEQIASRIADVI
jgi:hypothetical protein